MITRIQVKGWFLEVSTSMCLWITAQASVSIKTVSPPSVLTPDLSHLAFLPADLFHVQSGQASVFYAVTHRNGGTAVWFGLEEAELDTDIWWLQYSVPIPPINPMGLFFTTDMILILCVSSCDHLCCWKLGSEVNWRSWGLKNCCQSQLYTCGSNCTMLDHPFCNYHPSQIQVTASDWIS